MLVFCNLLWSNTFSYTQTVTEFLKEELEMGFPSICQIIYSTTYVL